MLEWIEDDGTFKVSQYLSDLKHECDRDAIEKWFQLLNLKASNAILEYFSPTTLTESSIETLDLVSVVLHSLTMSQRNRK
jgi:hypothetical protein